jgi:hypothetical protein
VISRPKRRESAVPTPLAAGFEIAVVRPRPASLVIPEHIRGPVSRARTSDKGVVSAAEEDSHLEIVLPRALMQQRADHNSAVGAAPDVANGAVVAHVHSRTRDRRRVEGRQLVSFSAAAVFSRAILMYVCVCVCVCVSVLV